MTIGSEHAWGMPRDWMCHARPILTKLAPTCSASSSPAACASIWTVTTWRASSQRFLSSRKCRSFESLSFLGSAGSVPAWRASTFNVHNLHESAGLIARSFFWVSALCPILYDPLTACPASSCPAVRASTFTVTTCRRE